MQLILRQRYQDLKTVKQEIKKTTETMFHQEKSSTSEKSCIRKRVMPGKQSCFGGMKVFAKWIHP